MKKLITLALAAALTTLGSAAMARPGNGGGQGQGHGFNNAPHEWGYQNRANPGKHKGKGHAYSYGKRCRNSIGRFTKC